MTTTGITAKICVHVDKNKKIMKKITRYVRIIDLFNLMLLKIGMLFGQYSTGMEGEK